MTAIIKIRIVLSCDPREKNVELITSWVPGSDEC